MEDQDVGILYLQTNFEIDRCTNNGDLLLDRHKRNYNQTHTLRLKLILFPNIGLGGVKK